MMMLMVVVFVCGKSDVWGIGDYKRYDIYDKNACGFDVRDEGILKLFNGLDKYKVYPSTLRGGIALQTYLALADAVAASPSAAADPTIALRMAFNMHQSLLTLIIDLTLDIDKKFTTIAALKALEEKLADNDQKFNIYHDALTNIRKIVSEVIDHSRSSNNNLVKTLTDNILPAVDELEKKLTGQITNLENRLKHAEMVIMAQKSVNLPKVIDEELIQHTVMITSVVVASYLGFWIGSKVGTWIGNQYNALAIIPKKITYWTGVVVGIIGFNALNILTMKYWMIPLKRYIG